MAAAGSTLRLAQEARGNTGNYMRLTGTSMAAGVASGVAALVLQANHGLTPNALKAVLEYSAIPVKDDPARLGDVLTQGAGEISGGAVALAQAIDPSAAVGSPWLSSSRHAFDGDRRRGFAGLGPARALGQPHRARARILTEQRPAWALNRVGQFARRG